jgi:hypothetical protein
VIRLKLQAPAVEGKANAALVAFLAEALRVPKAAVSLKGPEKPPEAGRGPGTRRRRGAQPATGATTQAANLV